MRAQPAAASVHRPTPLEGAGKRSPLRFLWLALALGVAFWAWRTWTGEEARIARRLGELRAAIEKEAGEGDLTGAGKANRLASLFTAEFAVEVIPEGISLGDRARLQQVAWSYRSSRERIGLDFRDVTTTVQPGAHTAETTTVAVVSAGAVTDLQREGFRVRVAWEKEEGEWRIRRLEVTERVDVGLL